MSDFDDDFDAEIFALASGDPNREKKRKRKSQDKQQSKKRRMQGDSPDAESEEVSDAQEPENDNPYPLEGKYIDEDDRERLMKVPEIEREEIISQRLEEQQKLADKRMLSQLVRDQQQTDASAASDSVSKAAKRPHTARGATKEKTRKLDELKAKRKEKVNRKNKPASPGHRSGSLSSESMDMSDASGERIENLRASAGWESEDGQIDDDADKRSRLDDKSGQPDGDATAEFEDIMSIRLTRAMIARHYPVSWFEEYVKNTWVRYLVGSERNQRIYRLLRVQDVGPPLPKPYKIEEDHFADCGLKLAYGDEVKEFNMDRISDGPCEQSEFKRLSIYCASVKVKLPTKAEVRIKAKQMAELTSRPLTESDINARVARKNHLMGLASKAGVVNMKDLFLLRSDLEMELSLARKNRDREEIDRLTAKLKELTDQGHPSAAETSAQPDIWAQVNARNRKANIDSVRRAEMEEARRRREAKRRPPTEVDPSARLRTIPRTFNNISQRPTPDGSRSGTPASPPKQPAKAPPVENGKSFTATMMESIELDLGDF